MIYSNIAREELSRIFGEVVDELITQHPYYATAPFLYGGDIDSSCPYFADNDISLSSLNICSEDLKTMAHLAPFYRNRLAYNPKNIDKYMWALGYADYDTSSYDILCYETNDKNIEKTIFSVALEHDNKIFHKVEIE